MKKRKEKEEKVKEVAVARRGKKEVKEDREKTMKRTRSRRGVQRKGIESFFVILGPSFTILSFLTHKIATSNIYNLTQF